MAYVLLLLLLLLLLMFRKLWIITIAECRLHLSAADHSTELDTGAEVFVESRLFWPYHGVCSISLKIEKVIVIIVVVVAGADRVRDQS